MFGRSDPLMTRLPGPLLAAATLAGTLAAAPVAMAQQLQFTGGNLRTTGVISAAGGIAFGIARIDGSVQVALSPSTFLEVDAAATHFGTLGFNGAAITAHAGHYFAEDAAVGIFASYAADSFGIFPAFVTLGAEVTSPLGPLHIEGYGAYSANTAGFPLDFGHLDGYARYRATERLSLGLGAHYATTNIGLSFLQARASARYKLADTIFFEAGYGYTHAFQAGGGLHSIAVSLTRTFGRGTTFSPRNQVALLSGF